MSIFKTFVANNKKMAQITVEQIEKAVEKVNHLDDASLDRLSETYTLAQTELLAYIMQASEEYENEELADYLIYYFCLIAEMFTQAKLNTTRVTDDMIDEFHETYLDLLEEYSETEDPSVLDTVVNQPNITAFIAEDLSGVDEDGEELDAETASQLFIVLVALVGLLNKSIA